MRIPPITPVYGVYNTPSLCSTCWLFQCSCKALEASAFARALDVAGKKVTTSGNEEATSRITTVGDWVRDSILFRLNNEKKDSG